MQKRFMNGHILLFHVERGVVKTPLRECVNPALMLDGGQVGPGALGLAT
jgi:hypothetical protein